MNLIMAAISSRIDGVLKVITQDEREHYITTDSYQKEKGRTKDGDILLSNCEVVNVSFVINS